MTIADPGDHRYDNGLSLSCHGHWDLGFCCFRVNMNSFSQLMKSEEFGFLVWLQMERNNLKWKGWISSVTIDIFLKLLLETLH